MEIAVEDNLTIVCATHNGSNRIPLFLDSIQNNEMKPKEIIICGTSEFDISSISKEFLINNNVIFIVSEIANQTYQRKLALSKVKTSYILQLDDDLILDSNAIGNYCRHFNEPNTNKKIVCGYTILPNGEHMSYRVQNLYKNSRLIRIFYKIINGFKDVKNMSILKSGRIFPLVLDHNNNDKPEWLSSCLMFHKDAMDNQVNTNFENIIFKGKAYYEDVFFTSLLRKKGFTLILDKDIRLTHPYTQSIKPLEYINTISRQKQLLVMSGGSYVLFYLDVIASTIFYSIKHIKYQFKQRWH